MADFADLLSKNSVLRRDLEVAVEQREAAEARLAEAERLLREAAALIPRGHHPSSAVERDTHARFAAFLAAPPVAPPPDAASLEEMFCADCGSLVGDGQQHRPDCQHWPAPVAPPEAPDALPVEVRRVVEAAERRVKAAEHVARIHYELLEEAIGAEESRKRFEAAMDREVKAVAALRASRAEATTPKGGEGG